MTLADAIEIGAKAAHAAYRAEHQDKPIPGSEYRTHTPEACPWNMPGREQWAQPCCTGCDRVLRDWDALTEAARESFRAQARPIVAAIARGTHTHRCPRCRKDVLCCDGIAREVMCSDCFQVCDDKHTANPESQSLIERGFNSLRTRVAELEAQVAAVTACSGICGVCLACVKAQLELAKDQVAAQDAARIEAQATAAAMWRAIELLKNVSTTPLGEQFQRDAVRSLIANGGRPFLALLDAAETLLALPGPALAEKAWAQVRAAVAAIRGGGK